MHRGLASRPWPCGRIKPGCSSSQLRPRLPVQLPPSCPRIAKYASATLGMARTRIEPQRLSLSSGLATIRFARCHSSRPSKLTEPSRSKLAQTATSELGPTISSVMGAAGQPDTAAIVDRARGLIFNDSGIPAEHDVLLALRLCSKAAAIATGSATTQPTSNSTEPETVASSLLSLDDSIPGHSQAPAPKVAGPSEPSDRVDYISNVAFDVITHPNVVITQKALETYVATQARLGSAETLPHVLSLYASKPRPQEKSGSIEFVVQDPHTAAAAVPPSIVEKALDVAIEVKDLDAAVGIIENTYGTKAFQKQKLLRKALIPASLAATVPVAVYLTASKIAFLQNAYDAETATFIAGVAMLAYVGFTGAIGMVALLTHNDQMRRVTYAPGIPLGERWLREEQRAAFDRVASSFGYSESSRFGEEEGEEFRVLRQFLLRKGMMLDRVELMDGMT